MEYVYGAARLNVWRNGKRLRSDAKAADTVARHCNREYTGYWYDEGNNTHNYVINDKMCKAPVRLRRNGNNVEIEVTISFVGRWADKMFEDSGMTYAEIARDAIVRIWSGRYYEHEPYDLFGSKYVDVTVKVNTERTGNGRSVNFYINKRGRGFAPYNIGWNIRGGFFNAVYCYAYQKSTYYNRGLFEQLAAHEFGHIIGLGDAYENKPVQYAAPVTLETPALMLMRDNSTRVTSNDIEMVLEAFKTNSLQIYDARNRFRSKVIRLNPE